MHSIPRAFQWALNNWKLVAGIFSIGGIASAVGLFAYFEKRWNDKIDAEISRAITERGHILPENIANIVNRKTSKVEKRLWAMLRHGDVSRHMLNGKTYWGPPGPDNLRRRG